MSSTGGGQPYTWQRPAVHRTARSGVSVPTISHIINGKTWPGLRTLSRLEVAVGARLWGKEHRTPELGGDLQVTRLGFAVAEQSAQRFSGSGPP